LVVFGIVVRIGGVDASTMKVDGGWPRLAAEPVWWKVDGSEFSSVLRSPFGLKWERMGTAPAKGLESKQRAELKSSSK
jgi:hypothetical protein